MSVLKVVLEIVLRVLKLLNHHKTHAEERKKQSNRLKVDAYDKLEKAISARNRARNAMRTSDSLPVTRYKREN